MNQLKINIFKFQSDSDELYKESHVMGLYLKNDNSAINELIKTIPADSYNISVEIASGNDIDKLICLLEIMKSNIIKK